MIARGHWWDLTGWFAEGENLMLRRVETDDAGRAVREFFVVHDGSNYTEINIWEKSREQNQ